MINSYALKIKKLSCHKDLGLAREKSLQLLQNELCAQKLKLTVRKPNNNNSNIRHAANIPKIQLIH